MEGDATVNGVRLHYRIDGPDDGVPLVFCNSLATDLHMWDEQIPALSDKYRILRYDRRGHGQSEAKDEPIEIKSLADDVVALAGELGFQGGHFCGLSIGGMTGQAIGIYHPNAFKSLAVCATSSAIPKEMHQTWIDRIATVKEHGMGVMGDVTVQRWFTADWIAANPARVAEVRAMIVNTSVVGYSRCCEAISQLDYTSQLGGIKTPTIIIPGEVDPALPPAMSDTIHKNLPGSRLETVMGAAHLCNVQDPDQFNGILRRWLDEQSA